MCRSGDILYGPSLPLFNFSSSLQSHTMLVRRKGKKRHNERLTSLQYQDELSFQIIFNMIVKSDEM